MQDNPAQRAALQLTPSQPFSAANGPQLPPQIPPEWVPLFNAAYNALPPGALGMLVKQYWYLVAGALVPLLLSAYGSVKTITDGIADSPAAIVALQQQQTADHKRTQELSDQVTGLNDRLDRLLWFYEHDTGKLFPSTQSTRPHE